MGINIDKQEKSEKEKMLAGDLYDASAPELVGERD
ncbi:MAG TPA: maltose acetyltransferase domain-containing protein [Bryobacteraceae bacterium]|nr:maltose acetyltransferase domain-containing protein [Bryobacteraceae bacterium]